MVRFLYPHGAVYRGHVPHHVVSGHRCPGGNAFPLEKNVAIAEVHLESMKNGLSEISGTEKGSVTRKIKLLKSE